MLHETVEVLPSHTALGRNKATEPTSYNARDHHCRGRFMQELLDILEPADYQFLIEVIERDLNLAENGRLASLLSVYEENRDPSARERLDRQLEREIGYLGSADLAYIVRFATGQQPGVPFREIVRDVARTLKVQPPQLGTDREQVEAVVEQYVTRQFERMSPEEQQRMLEELGVQREKAAAFLKRSAGVFAVPALIEAFGIVVVNGLIKNVIFGTIAKIIGSQLSARLFKFIAGRFPWWVRWIGPAAWTVSISWTVLDVQGPAYRKTVPIVLYLGLCSLRGREVPARVA